MPETWYEAADKAWELSIESEIDQAFAESRNLLSFDELNAIQASTETKRLFRELRSMVTRWYIRIAKHTRVRLRRQYKLDIDTDVPPEDVRSWFMEYNPVTKTQFDAEQKRRRAIMFEGLMVAAALAHGFGSTTLGSQGIDRVVPRRSSGTGAGTGAGTGTPAHSPRAGVTGPGGASAEANDVYERTKRGWKRQAQQGAIDIEDAAAVNAFEDAGIKYVRWVTEHDAKVCSTCAERDGVEYDIRAVPSKPHRNCRCHIEPVMR